jgi:hypothetical protein
MKVHRNLLWVRARPELIELLAADKVLYPYIYLRIAPDLIAIKRPHHQQVIARLEKLGYTPREVGQW